MERLSFVNARNDTAKQNCLFIVNARVAWAPLFRVSTGTNFNMKLRFAASALALQEHRPAQLNPQRVS